jgi:hypothetical protein
MGSLSVSMAGEAAPATLAASDSVAATIIAGVEIRMTRLLPDIDALSVPFGCEVLASGAGSSCHGTVPA